MQSTTRAAHKRRHLSLHERQRQARVKAFSRGTPAGPLTRAPVKLAAEDLALIERLVRHDRTAVSTALLVIAGIGAGEPRTACGARVGGRGGVRGTGGGHDQREPSNADRPARSAREAVPALVRSTENAQERRVIDVKVPV